MLVVRWTIGDVSERGFAALRLALWGAERLFPRDAQFVVCVNNLSPAEARQRAGRVPVRVQWRDTCGELPAWLAPHVDPGMAQGVAWKFAPLRLAPDAFEIALDNDCVLWSIPEAMRAFLGQEQACLLAADVRAMFGQFAPRCGAQPLNSGIRGLPPGFDLEAHLRAQLAQDVVLRSELDEQGLQVAALSMDCPPLVVALEDVSICSPFPPHLPGLGRAGAHFVGLNARALPWAYANKPATRCIAEHFDALAPELRARIQPL